MPHQCTQCGHTFADGSKEMLSGCPDCGGNKFQFKPAADARASGNTSDSQTTTPESEAATAPDAQPDTADTQPSSTTEDPAQSDARREVRPGGDLAESSADDPVSTGNEGGSGTDTEPERSDGSEAADESEMAALRRELDDQFESIKILEPGQYELNLMELYNREEYIIALQEDGQYVIEVPETWLGD